jgi:transcriptional antiterminator
MKRTFERICCRREEAVVLKHQGLKIKEIADRLSVSSKTIKRDFVEQGDELLEESIQIIEIEHKAVGIKKIDSHLLLRGFRILYLLTFSRTMQVLGKPSVKAAMTIHCSNLHH